MKAVVLAGGEGRRLRPYTFTVPKPLLPLGDRPLLDYIFAQLASCAVTDVILALGYQAELIKAYCGDGTRFGLRVAYVEESTPLGTAGPLVLCRSFLDADEPFFLMNGDIVTRLDFARLAQCHRDRGALVTVGYVLHTHRSAFGVLELEGDRVVGVAEKPSYTHPVSAGIYCISPDAVDLIAPDRAVTMPDLIDRVNAQGGTVAAYRIEEFWRALETQDHFEELMHDEAAFEALQLP
ncbi:MAG TPA: sugar phosphate nucleotidyltransferase [Gemmatimonadales bacterium]